MDNYEVLHDICFSRHSVRRYAPRTLNEAHIEQILNIAKTAPYASGKKNWEINIVTEPSLIADIATVVERASTLWSQKISGTYAQAFADYAEYFLSFKTAPAIFIPTFRITQSVSLMLESNVAENERQFIQKWELENAVKSIAGAGMLVSLASRALGLGSCIMTGALLAEDEIGRIINIKPGRRIEALIAVGYPDNSRD